jgi:type VI secretion system protein ImpK
MRDNLDVLELYLLCLSLGFRGKYQLQSPESVRGIIEELNFELKKYKSKIPEKISPNGYLSDEFSKVVKEGIPLWVITVIALFIGVVIYLIFSMIISAEADSLINEISKLIKS